MAFSNPSFEDPTVFGLIITPGMPDGWDGSLGGTSWEWALFNSIMMIGEDFESGWTANEGRRTVFGSGELDDPVFDVTTPEAFEDFEEEWSSNEDRKTEFSSGQLDDATFDAGVPEAFEDFEEEWSSNEDRRTVFGALELDDATFDIGVPEAFEDFEEEWSDNEDRRTVFGGGELDDAHFATGIGVTPIETFDANKSLNIPPGVAIGSYAVLGETQSNRIVFAGTLTGTLELQFRRGGFSTWETYETITSVPATVILPAGITEIRIERTVSGGTTTAGIYWPILTKL